MGAAVVSPGGRRSPTERSKMPRRRGTSIPDPAPDAHRTAVHEAGHALLATLAGYPIERIVLAEGGATHYSYLEPETPTALRRRLTVVLAGIAAELIAGCPDRRGWRSDLRAADPLAARLTPDPARQLEELNAALQAALSLLTAQRGALRALALAVLARGGIHGQSAVDAALDAALEASHA